MFWQCWNVTLLWMVQKIFWKSSIEQMTCPNSFLTCAICLERSLHSQKAQEIHSYGWYQSSSMSTIPFEYPTSLWPTTHECNGSPHLSSWHTSIDLVKIERSSYSSSFYKEPHHKYLNLMIQTITYSHVQGLGYTRYIWRECVTLVQG